MGRQYDVAAYIWPAYTGDEMRSRIFWPDGIGEWQTVKTGVEGEKEKYNRRKPVWGYVNEADPYVMEMEINAAADHGVNVFIYDWYWYDNRPFLENCLNDGYLKAGNNSRMKFYLMWANHDANNTWDRRTAGLIDSVIWNGAVTAEQFYPMAERLIERYFKHPGYYKIDGKPVFEIYDVNNLLKGLGGVENTRKALQWFREECVRRGLPGVHLQLTKWGDLNYNLSGVDGGATATTVQIAERLEFDSLTHYQFVHFTDIGRDYLEILKDVKKEWERIEEEYPIPYFPHISVGWDNTWRYRRMESAFMKNNTPSAFRYALSMAKEYADRHPEQPPLITINSWNEWTETSYLQPDELNGYGYLQAVKSVFADAEGEE